MTPLDLTAQLLLGYSLLLYGITIGFGFAHARSLSRNEAMKAELATWRTLLVSVLGEEATPRPTTARFAAAWVEAARALEQRLTEADDACACMAALGLGEVDLMSEAARQELDEVTRSYGKARVSLHDAYTARDEAEAALKAHLLEEFSP